MLSRIRRNLAIRLLVQSPNLDDTPLEALFLKAFLELALGFTGTTDLNGYGLTRTRNDIFVVVVETAPNLPVTRVLGRTVFGCAVGESDAFVRVGGDLFCFFAFVCDYRMNPPGGAPVIEAVRRGGTSLRRTTWKVDSLTDCLFGTVSDRGWHTALLARAEWRDCHSPRSFPDQVPESGRPPKWCSGGGR